MQGQPVDMSRAEFVQWSVDGPDPKIRVHVTDHGHDAIIELSLVLDEVFRVGNEGPTGFPLYAATSHIRQRLVHCDPALRVRPLPPPPDDKVGTR
jgi:hypothetical protein